MEAQGVMKALVTGGSRGVGKETVTALAQGGYNCLLLFREKAARAEEVAAAAQAKSHGTTFVAPIKCDISETTDLDLLAFVLNSQLGPLSINALVLAASGGLEPGKDESYPMLINRDAQVAILEKLWPFLADNARIVFDTSHWAHRYGEVVQLPSYEPIAQSKNAGGIALREKILELEKQDPRDAVFIEVTGDMLGDSMVVRLMERRQPGLIKAREEVIGRKLPTYAEIAQANVRAIVDPTLQNGQVVVVGGDPSTLEPLD